MIKKQIVSPRLRVERREGQTLEELLEEFNKRAKKDRKTHSSKLKKQRKGQRK